MTTSLFMVLRDNRAALYGQAEDLGRALAVGGGAARSWQGRRSRQIGRRNPLPFGKSLAKLGLRAPQRHITTSALVAKHGLLGWGVGAACCPFPERKSSARRTPLSQDNRLLSETPKERKWLLACRNDSRRKGRVGCLYTSGEAGERHALPF